MTLIIAHRGNIYGPNPSLENTPEYVAATLSNGYDVEIDVWWVNGLWWLGHDLPQYHINESFLCDNKDGLWCHAKNLEALSRMLDMKLRCFFHVNDEYTLTSCGHIWSFIGSAYNHKTVVVMPELSNNIDTSNPLECYGICTDYAEKYKSQYKA